MLPTEWGYCRRDSRKLVPRANATDKLEKGVDKGSMRVEKNQPRIYPQPIPTNSQPREGNETCNPAGPSTKHGHTSAPEPRVAQKYLPAIPHVLGSTTDLDESKAEGQQDQAKVVNRGKMSQEEANQNDKSKGANQNGKSKGANQNGKSKGAIQEREQEKPNVMSLQLRIMQLRRESASQDAEDSRKFISIWELDLLPRLENILDKAQEVGGEYSINVRRGGQPGTRIIDVMTKAQVSATTQGRLEASKARHLSGELDTRTSIEIRVGEIKFLSDDPWRGNHGPAQDESGGSPGSSGVNGDDNGPVMGDSVGPDHGGSGTMGPTLQIGDVPYRLLNWHVFDDGHGGNNRDWSERQPPQLDAFHTPKDEPGGHSISIGKTVEYSGRMHQTWRHSRTIKEALSGTGKAEAKPKKTVTDWVLVQAKDRQKSLQVNKIRDELLDAENITEIADPTVGRLQFVYSTGSASGTSIGQLCEAPGSCRLHGGLKTRNWAIESPPFDDGTWIRSSMGIEGDSGAPVVDLETHTLLGQIWGRNWYESQYQGRERPRVPCITFFAAMSDIYDDIEERMPGHGRPILPTTRSIAAAQTAQLTFTGSHGATMSQSVLASISEDAGEPRLPLTAGDLHRSSRTPTHRSHRSLGQTGIDRVPVMLAEVLGCRPLQTWARVVIHPATF
ncbi:hypothetical protein GGR56DRAFT_526073 [Xylariaceae sp. FL0804]|nr:hypothetical protein GGR56DRAFT_526073 [Xylariaceae sp. FL0804]